MFVRAFLGVGDITIAEGSAHTPRTSLKYHVFILSVGLITRQLLIFMFCVYTTKFDILVFGRVMTRQMSKNSQFVGL